MGGKDPWVLGTCQELYGVKNLNELDGKGDGVMECYLLMLDDLWAGLGIGLEDELMDGDEEHVSIVCLDGKKAVGLST